MKAGWWKRCGRGWGDEEKNILKPAFVFMAAPLRRTFVRNTIVELLSKCKAKKVKSNRKLNFI